MKEHELIKRMIQTMPKCKKCLIPLELVAGHIPQTIQCDLLKSECIGEGYGCTVECSMRCTKCGPHEGPVLLFYSILYNDIKDVWIEYTKSLTATCFICTRKCYSDSVFCCTICTPIPEATHAMCGKCAITNHPGGEMHCLTEFPKHSDTAEQEIDDIMSLIAKSFVIDGEVSVAAIPVNPETIEHAVVVRINKKKGEDLE